MNICCFSRVNYWHGIKGGMDYHGRVLSEGLVKKGHSVTIISSKHPNNIEYEHVNGVDNHYLKNTVYGSRRRGWAEKSFRFMKTMHANRPFDMLWSQSFDAFGYSTSHKKRLGLPLVATLHGCVAQEIQSYIAHMKQDFANPDRFARRIAGFIYAYFICQKPLLSVADRIISVSTIVEKDIGKWFGKPLLKKCIVIENGVDPNQFFEDAELKKSIRKQHHISDDEFVILSLGRILKEKGHQIAIHAMRRLVDRSFNVRMIIAGDGCYRSDLMQLGERLGIADRILFTGHISHDVARGYYNAADIFVMPTLTLEGLPFVILEAMACTTPVVASNIGGNAWVIDHHQNGILVTPGNSNVLAEQLELLMQNEQYRKNIAENGRRTVMERFTMGRMVDRTEKVFLELSEQYG